MPTLLLAEESQHPRTYRSQALTGAALWDAGTAVEPLVSPGRPIPEPRPSLFPPSIICLTQDEPLLVSAFQFLQPVLAPAAPVQCLWKASAQEGLEVDRIYREKYL